MKKKILLAVFTALILASWNADAQLLPGNINNTTHTPIAWFTPDNYINGTWINRITTPGTVGNFTQPSSWGTKTPPSTTISNFHPAVMFRPSDWATALHRMVSDNMIGITTDDAFTVIMVYKRTRRSPWDYGNVLNFSTGAGYEGAYNVSYHNDDGDDIISASWTTTRRDLGAVTPGIMQLLTIDNNNTGANGIQWYLGGGLKGSAASQNGSANTAGSGTNINDYKIVIGGAHWDITGNGERSFTGDVQELIILKRNRTSDPFLTSAELSKIHSYLAVKYGLTLTTDYVASNGTTVWNRTANSGYNNQIFGIARDDASGLYQKQSQSQSDNPSLFTAFAGGNVTLLNSENNGTLDNMVYAMFGSNGNNAGSEYISNLNDQYTVGTKKLNYRMLLKYKVRITGTGNSPESMTIKFKPAANDATVPEYMLISADENFPAASTKVIPFRGSIVEETLSDGQYISFAEQVAMPGNIDGDANKIIAWFTPDNYSNGTWINRFGSVMSGSVGNFTQPGSWTTKTPPSTTVSNFHPAVMFRPASATAASHRMVSDNMIGITTDDAFTVIMVHKRMQRSTWDYGNVFNFSTGTSPDSYYNAYNISYHNDDGDDVISASWTTSRRDLGAVTPGIMQLLTIDNNNTTGANGIQWYLGGQQGTAVATTNGSANTASGNDCKIVIGGSHEDIASDGGYSFTGDVQELIILKRNRMSDPFLPSAELSKIHSYLAVKYGLTLTTDYVASNGTTVWNRTASGVYNNHIFGIARDNDYGLYQKQSQSASASLSLFTAFVGNNVAILNSSNTSGLLDNNVYAMFGSNGQNFNTYTLITNPSDQYTVTGSTEKLNYRSALAYRLQVTGSLTMKFKPTANVAVPEYMLISTNQGFPADATTEVIPFLGAIPEKYFSAGVYYISFAGHMTTSTQGPGGVSNNLMLWLRADDETSVVTELLPVGDSKISGYPDAGTATVVSALSEWKDLVRNKTYSYAMGGSSNNHLEPVYQPSNYMTNFHPAVRFWGSSNVTWLGNTSGIWTTPFPANNKHSAFFVVNNNFGTHQWIYTLMFGSATTSSFNGPGYGVHKLPTGTYAGNVVGRFRTTGDAEADGSGTLNLFTPGATSILGYHHEALGQASNDKYNIKWRFNGLEDSKNGLINGAFGLNQASMIGRGFALNRTIQGVISEVIMYDGELSTTNMELVESYLALKYGITLTPTTHAGGRFDYRFSDGTMLWNGTAGAGTKWNTYYNRIAAVIRDDNANLHNRQSHSTNVGSILHMGVAGTRLGTYVDLGYLEHDREAVIWGDDGAYGSTAVDNGSCSSDEHIFNRKWRVCKITKDDRPVRMLVGAEDNSTNQLGQGASVADLDLFGKLKDNYDVSMIVLDPDDPDSKTFQAVVPMTYIDGEHQCAYTFTDSVTYITFGYKEKPGGGSCRSEVVFDGTKVFDWSQWTRTDYANLTKPAVDLGDGVQVTGTKVTYDGSIIIPPYYPSVTNTPVSQSLYIQRRSGSVNSEVTVTIEFNTPVRPEFSIYDIDGYAGCLEKVSITGECGIVTGILPGLSYGGDPLSSYYTIYIQPGGATAMASVRRDLSPTDSRGRLNVSFQDGVKKIIIKYSITDQMHRPSVANNLIVSPIRIRQIPPSPPRNEEGLSFVKDVDYRAITTCDHVGYSFYIENVVCESKYVNFLDTLPENMKWKAGISMDNYNANNNTSIKFNDYEGKRVLRIDSLLVPSSGALILTASATLDDDAIPVGETRRFNNHAWLKYEKADMTPDSLSSLDRETLVDETYFDATWLQRQDTVETKIETNRESYSVDDEITAILTVNNPNDNITDSYLEILYDAGFEYIAGSFRFESETPSGTPPVVVLPLTDSTLLIAGETGNLSGFTIPQGISTFTFKLRAPAYADLVHKLDENNQATNEIADLTVDYSFLSDMNDPCVIISLAEAWGTKQLPYKPVAAYNDSVSTFPLIPVRIDVMANDFIPKTCTPELDIIEPYAKHGTPVINPADSSFTYTPTDPDFSGVDSIRYYIKCGTDSSAANVYILVQNPLSMKYVACAGASVTMGFRAANGVQYYWYDVETGGNIVADGNSANTLSITKGSAADISTWWVEPRYGSVIFPRYRVDLEQSDNCGTANPVGCAATGTVIWSDDFGGNYNSSSQRASDPGWTGDKTTYTYVSRTNYWLPDVGEYALLKSIAGKSGHVWSHSILDDHTSWNDPNSGYFLTFDANQQPGEFYNFEIDNLCEGSKLTFTAWLMNINPPGCSGCAILPNTTFIIEDMSGNVLSIFYTGDIDKTPEPAWVNYSFDFVVPSGVSKLKVRFFNNQSQSGGGNDISIDDIEVRLCTPQVTMNISDITVCSGTTLDIVSTYIEDCTFGDKLAYKFEFRHIDSVNWKPLDLDLDGKTVDCDSPTEADRKLEIKWTIPSIRSENEGYYRMTVSSPANIDKVNCSASSDSVYVKVVGTGIPADIRIDVCPLPDRPIRLSSYLDSLAYNSVSWTKVGVAAPDILNTQTGEISSGGLTSTYTYRYSQTSQCGTGSAIAYVYPLKKRFQRATDTIVICKDEKRSRDIHIGHILGLNLNGGTWTYDSSVNPDNTLSAYMKIFPTSSSYEGALVFDAYKAWENTSDAYKVPRSGDANAKKFVFRYIAPAGNCIETQITKNIVIIITEKAF